MSGQQPYVTIRARRPADGNGIINGGSPAMGLSDVHARSATHDISRASFHVKQIDDFAQRLENSAARAFPNRGRSSQRYQNVQALLMHWGSDDLFVLPELEDLEKCLREDYNFGTDIFAIPSENSHLELMMRIGQLIRDHESPDTLFIVYYGGHARIDESRQSTWCATRDPDSPWLQWSAIQTLLERSKSDVLILLDCCAGAASATFPTGNSITETISASSWDAIAPDPGRYSFTNALIEVMQEWRHRVFSAAMVHAEVLARLKHPRPITINGKHFEARSTPVHFMMTANHKAPSIELGKFMPVEKRSNSAPTTPQPTPETLGGPVGSMEPLRPIMSSGRAANAPEALIGAPIASEPTEDTPHVMISLALEDDQRLDINAWEQWLGAFPAMAKYVKIQGVFKSHSTLLLVSLPVMIWDMLPEDPATSFIAFIRSNNIAAQKTHVPPIPVAVTEQHGQTEITSADAVSFFSGVSGTTYVPTVSDRFGGGGPGGGPGNTRLARNNTFHQTSIPGHLQNTSSSALVNRGQTPMMRPIKSSSSLSNYGQSSPHSLGTSSSYVSGQMVLNQQQIQRRTAFGTNVPEPKSFSAHVESRLEQYYQNTPWPSDGESAFLASNLGIEPFHLGLWFHHRRERDMVTNRLATMKINESQYDEGSGPLMILPADLSQLLERSLPSQVLIFDLRPNQEYQKSHIRGAINLRVPQSFIKEASLEIISRTITEDQGHDTFSRWDSARCMVFYSRAIENPWECPSARSIPQKFGENGWNGRSFILKGHFREFSTSFDQFVVGEKKIAEAGHSLPKIDLSQSQQQYQAWLAHVEEEDRAHTTASSPTRTSEKAEVLDHQEQELETELSGRCGELYRKIKEVQGGSDVAKHDDFASKAPLVESLDRGLTKLRAYQSGPPSEPLPYSTKLAVEGYFDRSPPQEHDEADEYVEISKGGDHSGVVRSGYHTTGGRESPSEEPLRRGRGGGFLNKVFRRA